MPDIYDITQIIRQVGHLRACGCHTPVNFAGWGL